MSHFSIGHMAAVMYTEYLEKSEKKNDQNAVDGMKPEVDSKGQIMHVEVYYV